MAEGAVVVVTEQKHAGAVAAEASVKARGSVCDAAAAGSGVAGFPRRAGVPAEPAVVRVGLGVYALVVAAAARWPAALPAAGAGPGCAGLSRRAGVPAEPAVVRVGLGVYALVVAAGIRGPAASSAAAARPLVALFPVRAYVAARPAVVGIGFRVDTLTVASGLSLWTAAHARGDLRLRVSCIADRRTNSEVKSLSLYIAKFRAFTGRA